MLKTVNLEDYEPKQSLDINALDVAVLIPYLNEEVSIGKVVEGFRKAAPNARVIWLLVLNAALSGLVQHANQIWSEYS